MARARIRHEAGKVLLEVTPGLLPPEAAREIARALLAKAVEAEEYARANQLILDAALLFRAGARFGLTSNPRILTEARKEAQSNRDLRRYLPGGIRSQEQIGRPTVLNVPGTSPAEIAAAKAAKENAA